MYTSDNFERFILKLISKIRKICSKKYHFLSDDAVMSLVEGIPIFKTISLLCDNLYRHRSFTIEFLARIS